MKKRCRFKNNIILKDLMMAYVAMQSSRFRNGYRKWTFFWEGKAFIRNHFSALFEKNIDLESFESYLEQTCNIWFGMLFSFLSDGKNRSSLSCSYRKLFVIKDCPVIYEPPCIYKRAYIGRQNFQKYFEIIPYRFGKTCN